MKLTIEVNDPAGLDVLRAYAERLGLSLTDAAARLVVTGAKRSAASMRYQDTPKGKRARQRTVARRAARIQAAAKKRSAKS